MVKNTKQEERTTFYAGKKISEQLGPKQNYDEIKKVIVIAILDYSFIELPEYITDTVRVAKDHREYELNNQVEYIYIELEKFRNQNPDMKEPLNQWLAFLDMERGELLEMAMEENEQIKDAVKCYNELTGDDEVKRLAEVRLMGQLEEQAALASARAKGTEEGLKQGKEEGKKEKQIEIANKLLELKMPINQIMKATGLTKEEIKRIHDDQK